MSVRRARHAPPTRGGRRATRSVTLPVSSGLHTGIPPQDLPPGFSPEMRNFVPTRNGRIRRREGLDSATSFAFGGAVLGATEVFDIQGKSCAFAPSSISLSFRHPDNTEWSSLSYVPGTVASAMTDGQPSGESTDFWNSTSVFNQGTESFYCVASNNTNAVKFFEVSAANAVFSDFTWIDSLDSMKKAADVESVNDRLVFFNTESSSGTRFPTRVYWSARGDPINYNILSGAGFEDLMDMKGDGNAVIRFRDFALLFTDYEIWRATPTLDDYAFRFDRVIDSVGCPFPRTIARAPEGVIFLGRDLELYITDGSIVAPLGPVDLEGPSRIQNLLSDAFSFGRAFAVFNASEYRYELYFSETGAGGAWPDIALFYDIRERTFWTQRFGVYVTDAADVDRFAENVTYDEVGDTYDSIDLTYDDYGLSSGKRDVNVFTSTSVNAFFSDAVADDLGTAIDARWRSGGVRLPDHRKLHLTEIWTDFETLSSSSVTLITGNAYNTADADTGTAVSLASNADGYVFTPVWKTASAPNIEIRSTSTHAPRIASFHLTLKDAGRF